LSVDEKAQPFPATIVYYVIFGGHKHLVMVNSAVEKLKSAFVSALGVRSDDNFESMAYGQTPGWDSIAHMALINEIETAFEIMLATDDVIGMSSFLKAKEIVARNGVSFA
jgi:acyl carrier protein